MRLRMIHQAAFEFDQPGNQVLGEARLRPQFTAAQTVLASSVTIEPTAWRLDYIDYWGAHVVAFNCADVQRQLKLTAITDVEVDAEETAQVQNVGWAGLADHARMDGFAEFLQFDESYLVDPEVEAVRQRSETPMDFLKALDYQEKLMGEQAAFSDLIATARWAGVPTRVVCGYLLPAQLEFNSECDAAVHSWLQIWDGGWLGWDPKLDAVPDQRHLVMATARSRDDIPTLTGVHDCELPARVQQRVQVSRIG